MKVLANQKSRIFEPDSFRLKYMGLRYITHPNTAVYLVPAEWFL